MSSTLAALAMLFAQLSLVAFGGGKVAYALGPEPIQTERRLREKGCQKRRNFFFRSGVCWSQDICSVS